jgi:3-oxoacyl-[acyl-carrier-protein] synthase III
MSVIYCEVCDRHVDFDLDDSHMSVGDSGYACNMSDDSPEDQGFYNDDPNEERP